MRGLRDIHIHISYGVDDGAQTAEDMYDMLDEAYRNKVSAIYCTSHRTLGVEEFPEQRYLEHIEQARAYCRQSRYPIRLFTGAEVLYTPVMYNYIEHHRLPTLGDTDCVLMEFVPQAGYDEVEGAVGLLEDHGYLPILAHIERYRCLQGNKAFRLKERHDVLFQVNCGTVLKGMGGFRARHIRKWFRNELIDYVSSDSHNTGSRPNRMLEAWNVLRQEFGENYARRLMADEGDGRL